MKISELRSHPMYSLNWEVIPPFPSDKDILKLGCLEMDKMTSQEATDKMLVSAFKREDASKFRSDKSYLVIPIGAALDPSLLVKVPCPLYLRARIDVGDPNVPTEATVKYLRDNRYDEARQHIFAVPIATPKVLKHPVYVQPERRAGVDPWRMEDLRAKTPMFQLADPLGKTLVFFKGDSYYAIAV
jgi:hypothetical protein